MAEAATAVEERFYEVVMTVTRAYTVRITSDMLNPGEDWEEVASEQAEMGEDVVERDESCDVDSVVDVTMVFKAKRTDKAVRDE